MSNNVQIINNHSKLQKEAYRVISLALEIEEQYKNNSTGYVLNIIFFEI